jgi:hypothetical protein
MSGAFFERVWLAALCAAVTACSSLNAEKPPIDPNVFPTNYRNAIVTTVTASQSYDPNNIREAAITEPALRAAAQDGTQRYAVCLRFNARSLGGPYMGAREYLVYFYGGDINQFIPAEREQCATAAYKPFPELEKICLSGRCG